MHRVLVVSASIVLLAACTPQTVNTTVTSAPATTRTDPTFPRPETTPPEPSPSTTVRPATTLGESASGCVSSPGVLQDLIDATPNGADIADMKGKLSEATALGFSVLDLSRQCFENQGTIILDGRYGLWIVRPTTTGSDWVLTDTDDTVLSGINLNGGSLSIDGGSQRIEAGTIHDLTVANVTDFMMGKMTIVGHTLFDSLERVDSDKSFARNCDFNTVELVGEFDGFKVETSTATAVVNNSESSTNLNLADIAIR